MASRSQAPDPDGVVRRPLTLSDRQRRLMESRGRTIVQPRPYDVPPFILDLRNREGVPQDTVFALEAIRHLAEQGNNFAKFIYEYERSRLGIDRPAILVPR